MTIEDGIIEWFDGPEWDGVAQEKFEEAATQVEEAARRNAEWEDRTGNARAGLTANAYNEGGIITLTLAHTVEYGRWLETIQSGRFAVIMRTLEENAKTIMVETASAIRDARHGRRV